MEPGGPRLKIRALHPAPASIVVGVAYRKGKITPAAGKFVEALRRTGSNMVSRGQSRLRQVKIPTLWQS